MNGPNGSLPGYAKAIIALGSAGVLALMSMYLVYRNVETILTRLEGVVRLEAALKEQRAWAWESYRVQVIQCQTLREMAKRDPSTCNPPGGNLP